MPKLFAGETYEQISIAGFTLERKVTRWIEQIYSSL